MKSVVISVLACRPPPHHVHVQVDDLPAGGFSLAADLKRLMERVAEHMETWQATGVTPRLIVDPVGIGAAVVDGLEAKGFVVERGKVGRVWDPACSWDGGPDGKTRLEGRARLGESA